MISVLGMSNSVPVFAAVSSGDVGLRYPLTDNLISVDDAVDIINSLGVEDTVTNKDYFFLIRSKSNNKSDTFAYIYRASQTAKHDYMPILFFHDEFDSKQDVYLTCKAIFGDSVYNCNPFIYSYVFASNQVGNSSFSDHRIYKNRFDDLRPDTIPNSFHSKATHSASLEFGASTSVSGDYEILCSTLPVVYQYGDSSTFFEKLTSGSSGGSSGGGSSGSYDNELGYLQNIKYTALKTGNSSNTGDSDYRFKVSYSLKTSTGVSLKDEGVGVQWLVKLKGGYETLMGEYNSLPTVNSSYYHIMDKSNHFYIDSGLYNDLVNEFRTSDVPFTASLKYTTYIYCRPYRFSSSGNTYGLWSRIDNKGGVTTINNGTTSTGDVSKESDGEDDDFISESTSTNKPEFGSGTDWDDAESNAGPTDSIGTVIGNNFNFGDVLSIFNSFKSGLGEFIKAMGDFPQLIAKTFPFLPTFITSAIGLGFLMAVVLRLLGR